jgi:hypothetical protein
MHPIPAKLQAMKTMQSVLITFMSLYLAAGPKAEAVSPPPDGGYAGGNTAEGQSALFSLTTGTYNTAVGLFSLRALIEGDFKTAIGAGTLLFNTADQNTATGAGALLSNATGEFNTANGTFALFSNSTGGNNTATGAGALFSNTTGDGNTATGAGALRVNTTGASNTAAGVRALFINNGDNNTATGYTALLNNTKGVSNTATGYQALLTNTTGVQNTAVGAGALASNNAGCCNTAVGEGALSDATNIGDCIAVGVDAGSNVTDAFNVIAIGHSGLNVSDTTWIDNIYGVTTQSGTTLPVVVSNQGQLGTASSSRRYKTEIKPMDKASETILALKPVSFRYKMHKDNSPQFGLIAEEVAEVNPDLVIYDADGNPYAVRYDAVNAMLLNEFLKEHQKVEALHAGLAQQQKEFERKLAEQRKQIQALAAGLEKVSAQLEVSKSAAANRAQ